MYGSRVLEHKDREKIQNFTHKSKHKNPICGDEMEVGVKISKDQILDFAYNCKSCIYCQASASLITKNIINKNLKSVIQKIKLINKFYHNQEISIEGKLFKIFNKKNYKRKNCIYLPINAIVEALKIKN